MTWEIFLGIVEIISLIVLVGGFIFKMGGILSELKEQNKNHIAFEIEAKAEHKEIQSTLNDHETRITVLEEK